MTITFIVLTIKFKKTNKQKQLSIGGYLEMMLLLFWT